MRTAKLSVIIVSCVSFFLLNGCNSQLEQMRIANENQQRRIDSLLAELGTAQAERNRLQIRLDEILAKGNIDTATMDERIALYDKTLKEKDELIEKLRQQLLTSGSVLTPELNNLLEEFAKANPGLVTYDKDKGIVKFSSDLLFNKGSDEVATSAANAVKSLCGILSAPEALDFDIVVAGHTDDIPIQKPETLKLHPSNWHLSVHRAISVEKIMEKNGIDPKRLSVRGFGEFRPIVPNLPDKGGAEQNRRVEIYIVPKGA